MNHRLPEEASRYLSDWIGTGWTANPLRGDASVRAYYRISADAGLYMLAYYPEEVRSQLRRFLGAHDAIASSAPIPRVLHHCDLAVLQIDVGDETLFDVLHRDRERGLALYRNAIDVLLKFQGSPQDARGLNPPFDAATFKTELEMTVEYYVEGLMERTGDASLAKAMTLLSSNVSSHPYVLCHRDYHGQNIHIVNDDLFVIDYQDLRMGPDSYDLASLLRDRGVGEIIGRESELELLDYYRQQSGADVAIVSRYFEALLQRSLKILGTFARQALTRGRTHYLDFIPSTLRTVERCLEELPQYRDSLENFPLSFDRNQQNEP